MIVKVLGLDPSVRNFAMVLGGIDLTDMSVTINAIRLIETESRKGKTVRSSSDDLRCCQDIKAALNEILDPDDAPKFVISEIPSGAQSARAAFTLGAALGLVAGIKQPVIEVNPLEVKQASVGRKDATKNEMIAWAVKKYPSLPWTLYDRNTVAGKKDARKAGHKKGDIHENNEHVADAIAAIHAGVLTVQFKQAVAIMRSMRLEPASTVSMREALRVA